MNPSFTRKELLSGLVDLLSLAIWHDRLEDAEHVLACFRSLKPKLAEADTYEAWIAMKRGFWPDAVRILSNLDHASPKFMVGKALLSLCQFANGEATWRATANEVLDDGSSKQAMDLVSLLMNPAEAMSRIDEPAAEPAAVPAPTAGRDLPQGTFLRG
jgi:type III secretion protein HrpB1